MVHQKNIVRIVKRGQLIEGCAVFDGIEEAKQAEVSENREVIQPSEDELSVSRLWQAVQSFCANVISLNTYGSASVELNSAIHVGISQTIFNFLIQNHCELVESVKSEKNETLYYNIELASKNQFSSAVKELNQHKEQTNRQTEFLLVIVQSEFEFLVYNILRIYFDKFPDAMDSSTKEFKLKEIIEFGSIEKLKQNAIEAEIQNATRGSIFDSIKYVKNKCKFHFELNDIQENKLIELCERRNIIVHNASICNETYLQKTKRSDVKIGDKLYIDLDYFKDSCSLIIEIGVSLFQVFWRKVFSQFVERADGQLIDLTYNLNSKGLFRSTVDIGNYWTGEKIKYSSNQKRFYVHLNYIFALRQLGEIKKTQEIDASLDWSTCDAAILLCRFSALENEDECINIISNRDFSSEISILEISTWPIFKFIRQNENVRSLIEDKIGKIENVMANKDLFGMLSAAASKIALSNGSEARQNGVQLQIEISQRGTTGQELN